MPQSSQSDQSRFEIMINSFMRGALAGTLEVGVNHPLFKLKLLFQANEKARSHPLQQLTDSVRAQKYVLAQQQVKPAVISLYQGILINAFSIVPTTAVQILSAQMSSDWLRTHTTVMEDSRELIAGYFAGSFAALIASPTEYLITQQQLLSQGPRGAMSGWRVATHIYQQQGMGLFTRGLFGTSVRDGVFVVGYNYLVPKVNHHIANQLDGAWGVTAVTNTLVGTTVSVISQPFDSIKAHQQTTGRFNFFSATQDLYRISREKNPGPLGGFYKFYDGGFFRGMRVVSALSLIDYVKRSYDAITPPVKS